VTCQTALYRSATSGNDERVALTAAARVNREQCMASRTFALGTGVIVAITHQRLVLPLPGNEPPNPLDQGVA
jgi:hypothetical protein